MARVTLRFYEELNDHLPASRRKRDFEVEIAGRPSVKHVLEGVGVPHPEVDLVVVDGVSVGFDHLLAGGERIAVYPVFESLEVGEVQRLRPRPLRVPRFVADVHLERLARDLRMLGFDTLTVGEVEPRWQDDVLAAWSARGRALLTRDRRLLMRADVERGYLVRSVQPRAALLEVLRRFDLGRRLQPFIRCLRCNGELRSAGREDAAGRVPPAILGEHEDFWTCDGCDRVYWHGSHRRRMEGFVASIRDEVARREP